MADEPAEPGPDAGPARGAEPPAPADGKDRTGERDRDDKAKAGGENRADRTDQERAAAEEARQREERFRAQQDPIDVDESAARAERRAASRNYQYVSTEISRAEIANAYFGLAGAVPTSVAVAGAVPGEDLDRLAAGFARPAGHAALIERIRVLRLVALHGRPGAGRTAVALHALAQLTGGAVHRVLPTTAPTELADELELGVGYVYEPRSLDPNPDTLLLQFDQLAARLASEKAYAVVVVDGTGATEPLVRCRYGWAATTPPGREVLAAQLCRLLADAPEGTVERALKRADDDDIATAVGLSELLPGEAARLAELLADLPAGPEADGPESGERPGLVEVCRTIVPGLVRDWFADLHRYEPQDGAGPLARPALALGVAVYNGAAYDLAADAAERLATRLAHAADPENEPGRRPAGADPRGRLACVRARIEEGAERVGGAEVPVRCAVFESPWLSGAVLSHAWEWHHNLRSPLLAWLVGLGENRRTVSWVRAAAALGVLASFDFPRVFHEALLPAAFSATAHGQLFAAAAIDQAANQNPAVLPAVRAAVREWGREATRTELRCTAAFVHGFGRVAGSTAASVRELRRIGVAADGAYAAVASHNMVQLLGGPEPGVVLDRIAAWCTDSARLEVANLGLLAVLRMCSARVDEVCDPEVDAEVAAHGSWPLPLGLVAAQPQLRDAVADALWVALHTGRTAALATERLAGWLRRCAGAPDLLDTVAQFLPQLINDRDDLERLWDLLAALVEDRDDPLPKPVARRLTAVLDSEESSLP